jgi:predicted O-linked N-acetylglucosamine transferase (SPINDLY family)
LEALRALAARGDGTIAPATTNWAPGIDGALQRRIAEAWTYRHWRNYVAVGPARKPPRERLRVGYVSPDFQHQHPIGRHALEIVKHHDRANFEIFAYALKPERQKDRAFHEAADHIRFLSETLSDYECAQAIYADEIDILVDLGGHTDGCRLGIFAHRPAPLQINYMGHGGTSGAAFIDYIIADPIVIPPAMKGEFTESVAYMPGCFFNCNWPRPPQNHTTRAEFKLPANAFIFYAGCATFKITPDVFAVWMQLLRDIPRSVLALRQSAPEAKANLLKAAMAAGVAADRIIILGNTWPERYLARMSCCDLLLDTTPFSAGSSAADALWAGLPVLTMAGATFASRMAASIVHAAGLTELIAPYLETYCSKAIEFAYDREELARLRMHLQGVRGPGSMFDSAAFTRQLEAMYRELYAAKIARP